MYAGRNLTTGYGSISTDAPASPDRRSGGETSLPSSRPSGTFQQEHSLDGSGRYRAKHSVARSQSQSPSPGRPKRSDSPSHCTEGMHAPASASTLARYIPQTVLERYMVEEDSSTNIDEPSMTTQEGALFFIDISGFVKLAGLIDECISGNRSSAAPPQSSGSASARHGVGSTTASVGASSSSLNMHSLASTGAASYAAPAAGGVVPSSATSSSHCAGGATSSTSNVNISTPPQQGSPSSANPAANGHVSNPTASFYAVGTSNSSGAAKGSSSLAGGGTTTSNQGRGSLDDAASTSGDNGNPRPNVSDGLALGSGRTGEELRLLLNRYFSELVNIVQDHGGDVLKFAGDALFVMWPVKRLVAPRGYNDSLSDAVMRAIQCGLDIQEQLDGFAIGMGQRRLSCKVVIGAGDIRCFYCGGVNNRWEFFVAGEPLDQIQRSAPLASPKQVLCSFTAAKSVIDRVEEEPIQEDETYRIVKVVQDLPKMKLPHIDVSEKDEEIIKRFVPNVVVRSYQSRSKSEGYLTEIRTLSTVFINFSGIDFNHENALSRAQETLACIQRHLYSHEGYMRQFIVEDKGSTFIGAFGMPNISHTDDAYRAVKFALVVHDALLKLSLHVNIGITTGVLITGNVGSKNRCEFSLTGESINLAARLMNQASGGILCDNATYQASRNRIEFGAVGRLKVKGKHEGIEAFRPLGRAAHKNKENEGALNAMCGRMTERLLLAERLQAAKLYKSSTIALVDGKVGSGKSSLIREASEMAEQIGMNAVRSAADALESRTPYRPWRALLQQTFVIRSVSNSGRGHDDSSEQSFASDADGAGIFDFGYDTEGDRSAVESKLRDLDQWNARTNDVNGLRSETGKHKKEQPSLSRPFSQQTFQRRGSSRDASSGSRSSDSQGSRSFPAASPYDKSKLFSRGATGTYTCEKMDNQELLEERQTKPSVAQSVINMAGKLVPQHHDMQLHKFPQEKNEKDQWKTVGSAAAHLHQDPRLQKEDEEKGICEKLAPLIGYAMGYEWEETEITSQLSTIERAEVLATLLANIVEMAASEQPLAILIDDVQWMDTDSWTVLESILKLNAHVFIMVTSLRHDNDLPHSTQQHLGGIMVHNALWIRLLSLSMSDVEQLMLLSLQCNNAPRQLLQFVYNRSQGNPLFAKELTRALSDSGTVEVRNRRAHLVKQLRDKEASGGVPGSLAGVLRGKIDRLSAPLQMCAKVASVIGREFDVGMLKRVVPSEIDPSDVDDHISELVSENIIFQKTKGRYAFRQPLIHEVAYTLLPSKMRVRVHQAVAAYLEVRCDEEQVLEKADSFVLPTLAYHWNCFGASLTAINYLERAAHVCLEGSAFSEAATYLGEILTIVPSSASPARKLRETDIRRALANANVASFGEPAQAEQFARSVFAAIFYIGNTRTAKLFRMMGQANLGMDYAKAASLNFSQAIHLLGLRSSSSGVQMSLYRLPEAYLNQAADNGTQLLTLAMPRLQLSRRMLRSLTLENEVEHTPETLSVSDRKSEVADPAWEVCECFRSSFEVDFYVACNVGLITCRCIVAAHLSEFHCWYGELAQFYAMQSLCFQALGKSNVAAKMRQKACKMMSELGPEESLSKANVHLHVAQELMWAGNWDRALEHLQQASKNTESTGDWKIYERIISTRAYLHLMLGQTESACREYSKLHASAQSRGNMQSQLWGLLGLARVASLQGSDAATLNLLHQRDIVMNNNSMLADERGGKANAEAECAFALMHRNQLQRAMDVVQRVVQLEEESTRTGFESPFSLLGLCKEADVLFTLYAESASLASDKHFIDQLHARCCQLAERYRRFAQRYPVALPRYHLYQGVLKQKQGNMKAARLDWQAALDTASVHMQTQHQAQQNQQNKMQLQQSWPFERACIQLEIAYHLEPSQEKLDRLEDALQVFSESEHQLHYDRVQSLHLECSKELSKLKKAR